MAINTTPQPNLVDSWLQNNQNNVQKPVQNTNSNSTQCVKDDLKQDTLQKTEPKKSFPDKLKKFFTSKITIGTSIVVGLGLLALTFISIKNKRARDRDYRQLMDDLNNLLNP